VSAVEAGLRYRDVLRLPHAGRSFTAALLGRLSFATVSLALLLAVQRSTGSFAAAGAATGAVGLTNVLVAAARARLVDRLGQPVALSRLAAAYAVLLCVVAGLTTSAGVPAWLLVTVAGLAGSCPPPLGAAMRTLWARLTEGTESLPRAYSLDAVAEEVLFVAGPPLVAAVAAVAHPAAALVGSAAVAVGGAVAMTRGPVTVGPRPHTSGPGRRQAPLRRRGFVPLLTVLLGVGLVLGTVEVAVPAFAQQQDQVAMTGVLLALLSVGSATGGLLHGRHARPRSLTVRLVVLVTGMTASTAVLAAAPDGWVLGGLLLALGSFLAPSLVAGYLLVDALTGEEVRTEASTWLTTACNAGAAAGAAVAGVLADSSGTTAAFLTGAALAAACVLGGASRAGSMRRPVDPASVPAGTTSRQE
jgi:hypothetical protein